MSDFLKHECGVAAIRLLKPLSYFQDKYGSTLWAFNKLLILMEKQYNRGQDGAGIGCVKLNMPLGQPYLFRTRDASKDALTSIFNGQIKKLNKKVRRGQVNLKDAADIKNNFDYGGEILMGHLRYGTSGLFDEGSCHPYLRRTNWPTRTLMVLGNFNMTNTPELNQRMIERGQHPVFGTDTQTVLEEIGYHLDEAHTDLYRALRDSGMPGPEIPHAISSRLNIQEIIHNSAKQWDGGYAIMGAIGNGDYFCLRDPHGIRPCHYLITDEFIAVASERVPLMTVFEVESIDFKGAIAGGGRYDNLIGKFLNQSIPAVGFSIGFERIFSILMQNGIEIPDGSKKIAVLYEDGHLTEAVKTAEKLRSEGMIASLYIKPKKTGKFLSKLEERGYAGFYNVEQAEEVSYFGA